MNFFRVKMNVFVNFKSRGLEAEQSQAAEFFGIGLPCMRGDVELMN